MLNFTFNDKAILIAVSTECSPEAINRNDITDMAQAEQIAKDATVLTKSLHVAVDKGDHTFPRFDVIAAPKVGDEVSRAFNGDYYPAGKIVKVSESLRRVVTDTGVVFYRQGQTAAWLNNRTWFMSPGHRDERNPSF